MLWRKVTKSNNSLDDIEQMYFNSVKHFSSCLTKLVTDLGAEKENVAVSSSYRYVASLRNQLIEGLWSY